MSALKAKAAAVKAYLVAHYKQLLAAVLAGKYSSLLLAAASGAVHAVSSRLL
jgi:hypothetical protein